MTMIKSIRRLAYLAAVGIAVLGLTSPARAQMSVIITDVSTGTSVTLDDHTSLTTGTGSVSYGSAAGITFGNYTIYDIGVTGNYDGNQDHIVNSGTAKEQSVTLNLTYNGGGSLSGGADQLTVQVTTANFASWTIPTGDPLSLKAQIGMSEIDSTNGTSTGSFVTYAGSLTSGVSTTTATAPTAYSSPASTSLTVSAPNPTPPFYLSSLLTIQTLNVNDVVNGSASTLVTGVPEPSTFGIALSGGLLMVAFGWRRNRRRNVE